MTMYAKYMFRFNPEEVPFISFSKQGDRNALLRDAKSGDVVVFVGTRGEETAKEDQRRVLGAAEIGQKSVRIDEVVDLSNAPETDFENGEFRWLEAIPMLRAWRFDPRPLASEVFENHRLPPQAQARAVLLSETDELTIRHKLNWVEVELPQTQEIGRQQRLSDALRAQQTKPGPVISPGTHTVTIAEDQKSWTYAVRFGASQIWKIGRTNDLDRRLQDLNAHVPIEYLNEQWALRWHQEWPSAERAQEMEQRVLAFLKDKRTYGERVNCSEDDLLRAWVDAIAGT